MTSTIPQQKYFVFDQNSKRHFRKLHSDGSIRASVFVDADLQKLREIEAYLRREYEVIECAIMSVFRDKSEYNLRVTCCDPLAEHVKQQSPAAAAVDRLVTAVKELFQSGRKVLLISLQSRDRVLDWFKSVGKPCTVDIFTNINDLKECLPLLKIEFDLIFENVEDDTGVVSYKMTLESLPDPYPDGLGLGI